MGTRSGEQGRHGIAALCMVLSGAAALVYQIVWAHQMAVAIGTAQSAVAIMLASFLGGLAVGGGLASRWLCDAFDAGRRYALLELFIAAWAIGVPFVFPVAQNLLIGALGSEASLPPDAGWGQMGVYLAIVAAVFGPPTVAMGATLPIIVRAIRGDSHEVASLYAMNTLGAAAGAMLAGFVLVPALGLGTSGRIAAAANVAAALLAWKALGAHSPTAVDQADPGATARWRAITGAGIAGIATFALEVFWTRLLAIPFGGTTRGFAFMLGLWLAGLAVGGWIATRRQTSPALALIIGAGLTATGYLAIVLTGTATTAAVVALLPGAIAFGMAYPGFVAAAGGDPARSAALIYAANTAGAVAGSLLAGHFLLELLGFGGTMLCAIALLLAAAATLAPGRAVRNGLCFGSLASVGLLVPGIPEPFALLMASTVDHDTSGDRVSLTVGRVATVEVRQRDDGIAIRSDGLPEALVPRLGTPPLLNDQHWLTALPALARPDAKSMMVVGLGGGVSLETVPGWIRHVDVVEIEARIIAANKAIAAQREVDPLADPRVTLVRNDARNALLRTGKRYDIIVSQPSHPWTAGSANLYTSEFVALGRSRLKPGGIFVQWMNASFVDSKVLRSFLATLAGEFGNVRVYEPVPFNFILMASDGPIMPENGFAMADAASRARLDRAGLLGPSDAVWSLLMDEATVRRLVQGLPAISDDRNAMAFESGPGRGALGRAALDALTLRPAEVRAIDPYARLRLAQAGLMSFAPQPESPAIATASARGAAGDYAGLAGMDGQLAAFSPTDPGFAAASQLRAAWRLERMAGAGAEALGPLAAQTLAIVDAALRVETTPDLLMQRATLAQVLGNQAMLAETALVFADIVGLSGGSELNTRRAQALRTALDALPASPGRDRAIAALNGIISGEPRR